MRKRQILRRFAPQNDRIENRGENPMAIERKVIDNEKIEEQLQTDESLRSVMEILKKKITP